MNEYEVFEKVASIKNITKVAELMGYTQSAVSHIIRKMEQKYGFPLFERSYSGVKLTANGEALLPYVRGMLNYYNQMQDCIAKINNVNVGSLIIGATSSISTEWLPSVLHIFLQKHPDFQIQLHNYNSSQVYAALQDLSIEVGFLSITPPPESSYITLRKDPLYVLLPKDHPLASLDAIPPELLRSEHFIALGSRHYIHQTFNDMDFTPNIIFTASTNGAVMAMVEQGLGISILPSLRLESNYRDIVIRPLSPGINRTLYLAFSTLAKTNPAVGEFLNDAMVWVYDKYDGDVEFRLGSLIPELTI
ncbi:MAG: LysR family transcriptional regulator [Lachnospiraceae bacterium]|nr:LysR family transcriptional regulator [Lachnospiraceae bacterium]